MTAACTREFSKLLILLLDRKLASVMITTRAALRKPAKTMQETQSQQHNAGNTVSAYQQLQKRADSVCSVCIPNQWCQNDGGPGDRCCPNNNVAA
jgi:hypothetical protein